MCVAGSVLEPAQWLRWPGPSTGMHRPGPARGMVRVGGGHGGGEGRTKRGDPLSWVGGGGGTGVGCRAGARCGSVLWGPRKGFRGQRGPGRKQRGVVLAEPGGLRHPVAVMAVESVGGNWGPLSERRLGGVWNGSQSAGRSLYLAQEGWGSGFVDSSGTVSVEGESEGDRRGERSWRKEGELGRERGSGGWEMWAGAHRQCPGGREAAAERGRPCAWREGPGVPRVA